MGKANPLPGSATLASGAMLGCFGEVTKNTLQSSPSRAKFELSLKATGLWEDWLTRINEYLPIEEKIQSHSGTFIILNSKSGRLDSDNFDAIISALKLYQYLYEDVDPLNIPGLDAEESSRPLKALYLPNEGFIDSSYLLTALRKACQRFDTVVFIDDLAHKINVPHNQVTSVETANKGIYYSHKILIAAGAYSQYLIDGIPSIKNRIPHLFSGVGYSMITEQPATPIKHVIRTPNRSGACGLHALPRNDTSLYLGATNNVSFYPEQSPSIGLIHFLLECGMEQINTNLHSSRINHWHVGNRPCTIDGYPLIGKTSIDGLWILTGTYRDGVHQSPLLAQYIAAEILGNPSLFDNIFCPERPLIQTKTKEEAIEEAVDHYICGAHERGIKLPKAGWDNMLRSLVLTKIQTLFRELETDFALSPDIVLMFGFQEPDKKLIHFLKNYLKENSYSLPYDNKNLIVQHAA